MRTLFSSWLLWALLLVSVLAAVLTQGTAVQAEGLSAGALHPKLSAAIYPPQSVFLDGAHSVHINTLGMRCVQCHPQATRSTQASDRLATAPRVCDDCHGVDHSDLEQVRTVNASEGDWACGRGMVEGTPAKRREGPRQGPPTNPQEKDVQSRQNTGGSPPLDYAKPCDTLQSPPSNGGVEPKPVRATGRSDCALCHQGYRADDGARVRRSRWPTPNLKFNHAIHARRNIGCLQCHSNVSKVRQATRADLPDMAICSQCHLQPGPARGKARGECATCHLSEQGRLKTHFPSGQLMPPRWLGNAEHGVDWLTRHGRVAGLNSGLCARCHTEQSCANCHDGRVRDRRVHPSDWLSLHGLASRQSVGDCRSCHRQQSFCITCHQRSGVAHSGGYDPYANRSRFHPPKEVWSSSPRTRQHHAAEAQRNLDSCVSCHVEQDCVACHATAARGGMGAWGSSGGTNPHPAGFAGRCGRLLRRNARPCLVCHEPSDPRLAACQ